MTTIRTFHSKSSGHSIIVSFCGNSYIFSVINYYLNKKQRDLLRRVAEGLGIGESEVLVKLSWNTQNPLA
jgi:hypothetical protein